MEHSDTIIDPQRNTVETETLAQALLEIDSGSSGSTHVIRDPLPLQIKVVDCSVSKDAKTNYQRERIPGARFLDLNEKFIDPDGKYPTTYPTEAVIRKRLGQLGIKKDDEIVCYVQDDATRFATRALFIFKSIGFSNTAILNGGLTKWKSDGYAVETSEPQEELNEVYEDVLEDFNSHLLSYEEVKSIENNTDENAIIDARPPEQYEGKEQPAIEGCKPGHIPNAINIPSSTFLEKDGSLKTVEELKEIIEKAGVSKEKQIICHCNGGNQATIAAIAFKECGYQNVKLYDGSWNEYGSHL